MSWSHGIVPNHRISEFRSPCVVQPALDQSENVSPSRWFSLFWCIAILTETLESPEKENVSPGTWFKLFRCRVVLTEALASPEKPVPKQRKSSKKATSDPKKAKKANNVSQATASEPRTRAGKKAADAKSVVKQAEAGPSGGTSFVDFVLLHH